MSQNNCLLLFAKSPVKGQVKTRLATQTGGDFVVKLYKCFVEDTLSQSSALKYGFTTQRKKIFTKIACRDITKNQNEL